MTSLCRMALAIGIAGLGLVASAYAQETSDPTQPGFRSPPVGNRFSPGLPLPDNLKLLRPVPQAPANAPSSGSPRAILFQEDPNNPSGSTSSGIVNWSSATVSESPDQPAEIVIRADVDIPDRMRMSLIFRRNSDRTLSASHVIEVKFELPADFPSGGTSNVPGILMKQNQATRGAPLKGLSVKLNDNQYRIGLSSVKTDYRSNIMLLKERSWLDVPIVFSDKRRAIVSIEKGALGETLFAEAFAAWEAIDL